MRLYEFSGESDISVFGDVVDALTAKWGKPLTASGKVQNRMGSWFEQTTAVWSNALSSITVQSRFNKIDEFGLIVTDQRLSKIISDARAAQKAATPNAI